MKAETSWKFRVCFDLPFLPHTWLSRLFALEQDWTFHSTGMLRVFLEEGETQVKIEEDGNSKRTSISKLSMSVSCTAFKLTYLCMFPWARQHTRWSSGSAQCLWSETWSTCQLFRNLISGWQRTLPLLHPFLKSGLIEPGWLLQTTSQGKGLLSLNWKLRFQPTPICHTS